ncbi:MAG: formate dehydrogenase subunit alpha, partial [Epsilonproteobacteria bacterium]|nr:formate dehydrogenase subunit alpha [Campylobacterota bacterium]
IKENGEFREASWDEALDLIAKKLTHIKEKYGPDAICGLSSAKCTNEENYLFQKFIRTAIGTNNIDHCARLCHSSTVAGLIMSFGSGAMTNSISELEKSNVILLTGSNITEAHPVIAIFIKKAIKNNNARLILADPRKIDIAKYAAIHMQQKNGTDVALLNGMMNVIINEGLENKKFIEERTEGFEEFKSVIMRYTPEYVEKITGINKEDIIKAARLFANAENASIVYAMGITQHTTGTDNVLSTANLSLLTGNVGKLYSGVNPLRGQNNVQGACDVGALPNVYPGYQRVNIKENRNKFEKAWNAQLSYKFGLTVVEMMHSVLEDKTKAFFIMGENPVLSDPNIKHVKKALNKVEFLAVQDIYLSETAEYADVVLPACSFLEKDGTFTNTERRILPINKILNPIGQSKSDWEIICDLSTRMGYKMHYENESEIMNEIASLSPIYAGVNYDRLNEKLQWPVLSKNHPGTPFLHKDKFAKGLGSFKPVDYAEPAELPDNEYPFVLSTGRILYHYHTGTITRRSKYLTKYINEPYAEVNPDDAKGCGVEDGGMIKVSTRRGEIVLKALYSDRVFEKSIFIPFHFKEAAANVLTNDALDPIAKIPEYKVASAKCRIEKV